MIMQSFLVFISCFSFLIVLFSFIFKFQGRKRFRIAFSFSHIVLMLSVTLFIVSQSDDAQLGLCWVFPAIIDIPISILMLAFPRYILPEIIPPYIIDVVFPVIFFVVFGTIQYYFLGWGMDIFYRKIQKSPKFKNSKFRSRWYCTSV